MSKERTARAGTVVIVWIFAVLELALALLTFYALWAKAGGIEPVSGVSSGGCFNLALTVSNQKLSR